MQYSDINKRLLFSVFTVNLLAFATGNAYAWSSTVLTTLKSDDPEKNPLGTPISSFEESWIASLVSLGASFGPILAGVCSDLFGRKRTLLIFAVPMLVSHLIISFASTTMEFYIARFMMGLGAGCSFTVIPIYVGEIAETEIRGLLGCVMAVLLSSGMLMVYTAGPYVDLLSLSFMLMVPIGLFIVFFGIFVPESPYYLVAKGRKASAQESLTKLRWRNSSKILKELSDIREVVEESKCGTSFIDMFKSRSFKKGITITTTLMFFQQFVGITIILSYMESIFAAAGSTGLMSPSSSTILVSFIQLIIIIISSFLVDKWGRKTLLLIASGGSALPLAILGCFFYMKRIQLDTSDFWWVPTFSLVIFIVAYNFGLGALPWALVGELFSSQTKAVASSLTAFTCLILAFSLAFMFPSMEGLLGLDGSFWLFSVNGIFCMLFVLWYVPETKGKSFQEILKILER